MLRLCLQQRWQALREQCWVRGQKEPELGDDGVQELSKAWAEDGKLTTIDLKANAIGVAGAAVLGGALRSSISVTSVDVSQNPSLGDEGARLLVPSLITDGAGVSTIRSLSLIRCSIGDAGAVALAQGLCRNSVLEQLKLTGNRIGNIGAIALAESQLGTNGGFLAELWLSSNLVGLPGADAMATVLAKGLALRELHVAGNALGDLGVAALVQGAVAGQGLRGLYANGCGVRDAGAKEIANIMQNSTHLETLCLGHGFIGDDGISALSRTLGGNCALRRLLLSHNLLKAAAGKAIAGMLQSNQALLCLNLSNNHLGAAGVEAIASGLVKNRRKLTIILDPCFWEKNREQYKS